MSGPDVWGPHGWKFIHFVTLGYPNNPSKEQKKTYKNFFESLQKVIPCSICANHYKKHLGKFPLSDDILNSKRNLIEWGMNVHNAVNITHGKKIYGYKDGLQEIIKNSDTIYVSDVQNNAPSCDCPGINESNKSFKSTLTFMCILGFLIVLYLILKKNNLHL
jgi:hypothetical protein